METLSVIAVELTDRLTPAESCLDVLLVRAELEVPGVTDMLLVVDVKPVALVTLLEVLIPVLVVLVDVVVPIPEVVVRLEPAVCELEVAACDIVLLALAELVAAEPPFEGLVAGILIAARYPAREMHPKFGALCNVQMDVVFAKSILPQRGFTAHASIQPWKLVLSC